MRKGLTLLAFCVVGLVVPRADAVIIYQTGLNTVSIPGLTGFATNGAMMDGLAVTATFTNGSQLLFWADTGACLGWGEQATAGISRSTATRSPRLGSSTLRQGLSWNW